MSLVEYVLGGSDIRKAKLSSSGNAQQVQPSCQRSRVTIRRVSEGPRWYCVVSATREDVGALTSAVSAHRVSRVESRRPGHCPAAVASLPTPVRRVTQMSHPKLPGY